MRPLHDRRGGPWLLALLTLVLVLGADQLSKHLVNSSIVRGEERSFLPGVELVNTRNRGVAFGFLPGEQTLVTILIGLALVLLLVGALGNILDRLRHGSVTDFIKLPLGWPPFNLADAAITLGIVALFLILEHARRHQQ